MEKYLNTPIKEIITAFPKVGEVLEEYNIGCVPCNVGSCLLKDIVEIHNLSEGDERTLLERIAEAIYSGKKIPKIVPNVATQEEILRHPEVTLQRDTSFGKRKQKSISGEIKYSPPIKRLVDEHVEIKRLVALIPKITTDLDIESENGKALIRNCVNFIRNYADKYHHAKEEEILFKYFDENLDILKVMHQDHENARGHVRSILDALDKKDKDTIAEHLRAYHELLKEHIKKEDEILYPWIDRNLSVTQVGELFSKFNDAERTSDKGVIEACRKFVQGLEEVYKNSKETEVIK